MSIPTLRWRAILLPAGVAAVSILALAWFNFFRIPAQQRYLNERNLRVLRTIGAQIKAKVDYFDQAIDHALDSVENPDRESLAAYVKLFAPDLEILQFSNDPTKTSLEAIEARIDSGSEQLLFEQASDPPRVALQHDEGTNFLYLGYRHSNMRVVARANIEQVAAAYLPAKNDFDTLLLADREGRVIVQQSSMGVELARIDRLLPHVPARAATPAAGESNAPSPKIASGTEPTNSFQTIRVVTTIEDVILGDASFRLYLQPIQLSLLTVRRETNAEPAKGRGPQRVSAQDEPEEWVLCGLVRADHLTAASSAMSYNALLLFGALLACVCLAVPLMKLHVLHPRERLRRSDGVWVAATTFLMTALATFVLLDAYECHVFKALTDSQLQKTANEIASNLSDELRQISEQMDQLQEEQVWRAAAYHDKNVREYHDELSGRKGEPPKVVLTHEETTRCKPAGACRDGLLALLGAAKIPVTYPYFELNTWNDVDGRQRIKWTTGQRVTPFLDLVEAKVPYYPSLKQSALLQGPGGRSPQQGVSVFQSPNTGNKVTAFWKVVGRREWSGHGNRRIGEMIGQSISLAEPISLAKPVLPGGLQFAVVESSGRVLFHTDHTRSLQEDFFQECEDSLPLHATIAGRRDGFLTAVYRARLNRLYVRPLNLEPFGDPNWSLVVFQDLLIPQTVNLYTLGFASLMFTIYATALAIGWAALFLFAPVMESKWFWPDPRKGRQYRTVALMNGIISLLAVCGVCWFGPTGLVVWTVLLTGSALLASYAVVARLSRPTQVVSRWRHEFLWARTSLLLVTAAVPAIVCFFVSSNFETRLLIKRGQLGLAMDLQSRREQIQQNVAKLGLCDPKDTSGVSCPLLDAYIKTRETLRWDVHLEPFFGTIERPASADDPIPAAPNWPEAFLQWAHVPFNDVAVDLTAAASNRSVPDKPGWRWTERQTATITMMNPPSSEGRLLSSTITPAGANGWLIGMFAAFVVALHGLLRYVVEPMYGLDLYTPPTLKERERDSDDPTSVLLIGPPGAGKSSRLKSQPNVWVFDLRLTRKRSAVVASVPFGAGPLTMPLPTPPDTWDTAFDAAALPTGPRTIVGVDHFEHRLGEPDFRDHLLRFLEDAIYRDRRTVWIASDREPLELLEETGPRDKEPADLDRWRRLFQSFRKEIVGFTDETSPLQEQRVRSLQERSVPAVRAAIGTILLRERALTPPLLAILEDVSARFPSPDAVTDEDLRREMRNAAEPYYRVLWSGCSTAEKLALRQLADEGVINPTNRSVVQRLIQAGLVLRDPACRIMNRSFEEFVATAEPTSRIATWEREGVVLPWASIKTALLTIALSLGGLLILTQQQLVGAWIGLIPTLAPVAPAVLKMMSGAQRSSKPDAVPV